MASIHQVLQPDRTNPTPSEQNLCRFAAILSQTVAWKTIRIYLSALRYFQIRAGLPDPSLSSFPQLNYVLKGIHRSKPDHQQKHRLPITIRLLISLHEVWSKPPVLTTVSCCGQHAALVSLGSSGLANSPAQEQMLQTSHCHLVTSR